MIMKGDDVLIEYLESGFVKIKIDSGTFESLYAKFAEFIDDKKVSSSLENFHKSRLALEVNDFRLKLIDSMSCEYFREQIYKCAHKYLDELTGNELAIQRRPNLGIHMPADKSSVIPIHTDVLCGNSPFETVVWIPLTDCNKSSSLFILPRTESEQALEKLKIGDFTSTEEIYKEYEDKFIWPEFKKGEALLFSHHLFHGNEVNREETTRWSINCRFKSLFSPYGAKKLGDYFVPLYLRPQTVLGKGVYERKL